MIELPIPAEITKYEPKLVGPLTARQTVFGGIAVVGALAVYNLCKDTVSTNVLYGLIIAIALPFGVLGWWKPYGMHAEKFILAILFNSVISPTKRFFVSVGAEYLPVHDKYWVSPNADKKVVSEMEKRKKLDEKERKRAERTEQDLIFE